MKWPKTHPTIPHLVFLFGGIFGFKPDFIFNEKKLPGCNFQNQPKPLHTNVHIIGTFICMQGFGKKNEIYGWIFLTENLKFEISFTVSLRGTRWPVLKFKMTFFYISFSLFEIPIKF